MKHRKSQIKPENSKVTPAILVNTSVLANTGSVAYFKYEVDQRSYQLIVHRKFPDLSIGDTVMVMYRISDPSNAKLVNE